MYRKLSLYIGTIVGLISLVFLILLIPSPKFSEINSSLVNCYTIIALINIFVFLKVVNQFVKTWVRFDLFFLLGFFIVHFQTVFLYTSLSIEPRQYNFWTNKSVVNYGIWYSTLILIFWMFGYYLYLQKVSNIKPIQFVEKGKYNINYHPLFDYIILCTFLIFGVLVGGAFWSGSYEGASNWGAGATYVFLVLRTLISLRIVYFFINNSESLKSFAKIKIAVFKNKIFIASLLIFILIFFIQGDRGPVMQMGLLIAACYTIFVVDISFSKIFIGIISAALVFTIIGLGRSSDAGSRDGGMLDTGFEKFQDEGNGIIPTDELAWSGSLFFKSIDLNPKGEPFLGGYTVFNNLLDVIPMSTIFYQPPKYFKSSTNYFTFIYKGPNARFGVGSAIIADLYINFGSFITVIIFFAFGYFMAMMTIKAHIEKNFYWILFYVVMMSLSVYINRANFLTPLKYIFYLIIFSKIFTHIVFVKYGTKKSSISDSGR